MADVFISYHEKSAGELARQIADALENVGISCWYAKRDIPPGGDFARHIPPQIETCKVFLLILNKNVYQSKHIESELGLAFSRCNRGENITILPLEIGNVPWKSWIKYYLIHTQSVKISVLDAESMRNLTRQVAKLLNQMPQLLPILPELTPALPQVSAPSPSKLYPSVLPQFASPYVKIIKSGECGNNVTYTLNENGVLTISGKGPMRNFKWDDNTKNYSTPWKDECSTISHVEIENGVTTIGEGAFHSCEWLQSVNLQNSVKSINAYAFAGCIRLTNIDIPDKVAFIEEGAFYNCTWLKSVHIPDSMIFIGDCAFYYCVRLKSVSVPVKAVIEDAFLSTTHVTRRT